MSDGGLNWEILERALDRLLDAPPEDHARILTVLRKKDKELSRRAATLLGLALENTALPITLDEAAPNLFTAMAEEDVRDHIGERLGSYRIIEIIRRGGMGVVFRGERVDGAFEQDVAIKLIPASIASATTRTLFDQERRHLARLEHPNIARIIDAGVTSSNTPYYVMEYIEGASIDVFLTEQTASRREILRYFLQLCDAVAFCHRSMVVHGDIKPNNVLVADGRVRLLDFGIGRFLDQGDKSDEQKSIAAFSPGYAAPEQVKGERPTIQSDVYSMGMLLRHLLAGDEAAAAQTSNGGNECPADLSAILDCCTVEKPLNRYESVEGLRSDVRAFLGDYPVAAYSATRIYRSGKFISRNTIVVGAMLGIVLALGAGLSTALWQYGTAREEAIRAEQVKTFLTTLFEQADPYIAGEQETTLREVVDMAAARLDTELKATPEVRNEIRQLIGNAYFGVGEYDKAFALHQTALSYLRKKWKGPHIETVKALNALGADYSNRGEYEASEQLHREAIEQLENLSLTASEQAVNSWTGLGLALTQLDPPTATIAMLKAHRINLIIRPNDSAAILRSLGNVASGYRSERKIEKSAEFHEQALTIAGKNAERLAPEVLNIRCNLALDYGTLGFHEKARAAQKICNDLTNQRLGANHPANVPNLNNLGALELRLGSLANAEKIFVQALNIAELKLPPKSLGRLAVEINYAVVLWHSGKTTEAETQLRDILERMEKSVGASHPASGRVRSILGRVVLERGDAQAAQRFLGNSLEGLTPYWRSDALLWLAEARLALDDPQDAAALAQESLDIRRSLPHYTDWQIAEAKLILALATNDKTQIAYIKINFEDTLPSNHFRRQN